MGTKQVRTVPEQIQQLTCPQAAAFHLLQQEVLGQREKMLLSLSPLTVPLPEKRCNCWGSFISENYAFSASQVLGLQPCATPSL
jgi:hypothetical protein